MPGIDVMISKIFSPKIGDFYSNYNIGFQERNGMFASEANLCALASWRNGHRL
jgi:hypothetical protein